MRLLIQRALIAATAIVSAGFGTPALVLAQDTVASDSATDDGSYDWYFVGGLGRFSGYYELPEETIVDVLNIEARRYLRRGELRISMPYLRIEGPADIQFIGGQTVGLPGRFVVGDTRRETGIGDVVLRGDYYLRTGTSTTPWLIGTLRVKLPVGDEDKGLGTGATDVEIGLGYIQRRGRINWLADVGYTAVGSSETFELEDVIRIGAGLSVPFGENESRSFYAYLENRTNIVAGLEDRRSVASGVEFALDDAGRLRVSVSAFVGLTDTAEDHGLYFTLGRRY